jgi:hypothetical protein
MLPNVTSDFVFCDDETFHVVLSPINAPIEKCEKCGGKAEIIARIDDADEAEIWLIVRILLARHLFQLQCAFCLGEGFLVPGAL